MYLNYNDHYWCVDIETESLSPEKIWVVCAVNVHTQVEKTFTDPKAFVEWLDGEKQLGGKFVFHNGIGFDVPVLNRLWRVGLTIADVIDTLVMSMVYSPSLEGGHSLDEWGVRMRFPKGKFDDFARLSDEMIEYCLQDCRLTRRVFLELLRRMNKEKFSLEGIELEHRSWQLVKAQQKAGFAFNIEGAHCLLALLREKENETRDRILEYWPPKLQPVNEYQRPFKKDGTPSKNYLKHLEEYEKVELSRNRGSYRVYAYVAFNIGSPLQRTEKLLALGWRPREFTDAGSPRSTIKGKLSPSLEEFVEESGKEEVRLIAKWIEVNARANMINTWIEAYNERTGCIHGSLWLANTLRYRHSNPNTANIPAVRINGSNCLRGEDGVWTYEARDLWTVRSPDRSLVGVDAKGIQLRVLAHYLNNPAFTEAVLGGDPHSYNQDIGGFSSRAVAKTFIYAFLLGAGDAKVGEIIQGSSRDGKEVKARFINNFPGLANLLDSLQAQLTKSNRIILCDGTPLLVTQPHTRLGYLLQGDESRIMKRAAILTAREVRRRELDVIKVGDIHDEWQNDTLTAHTNEFVGDVLPNAFRMSGESFKYRLPIDCDSKIGKTWASTH